jgi:hypothetical protein
LHCFEVSLPARIGLIPICPQNLLQNPCVRYGNSSGVSHSVRAYVAFSLPIFNLCIQKILGVSDLRTPLTLGDAPEKPKHAPHLPCMSGDSKPRIRVIRLRFLALTMWTIELRNFCTEQFRFTGPCTSVLCDADHRARPNVEVVQLGNFG